MPAFTSDRRLYLAEDQTTVVEDGDPRAAFLLVAAGGEVSAAEAKRLGLSPKSGQPAAGRPGSADDADDQPGSPADGDDSPEPEPVRAKVVRGPQRTE